MKKKTASRLDDAVEAAQHPIKSKPPSTDRRKKIDWLSIETDFVQGYVNRDPVTGEPKHIFPSLKSLCKSRDVDYGNACIRARKYQWNAKKQNFREQIQATRSAQNLSGLLSESTKFDSAHLAQIEMLHGMVNFYLNPYQKILEKDEKGNYTHFQNIDLSNEDDRSFYERNKPAIKDMATLMAMIKDSHTIVRNILGEPINAATVMNSTKENVDKITRSVSDMTKEERDQRLKDLQRKKDQLNNK